MVKWFVVGLVSGMVAMSFMDNARATVAEDVWVVEYNCPDFSDCNGVFATEEGARESIENDFARCSDIWHDIEMREDDEDWKTWNFVIWCEDDLQYEEIEVTMYRTEIQ